jgi:hypothetical protein
LARNWREIGATRVHGMARYIAAATTSRAIVTRHTPIALAAPMARKLMRCIDAYWLVIRRQP